MKIKIVYGAPCSGKSTYVSDNAGDKDLIYDYDKLLLACTNRTLRTTDKHYLHGDIISLRKTFVDLAKSDSAIDTFWLICSWITDDIKKLLRELDTEEIFIDTSKEKCYEHLSNDNTRPDKEKWREIIDEYFEKYLSGDEVMNMITVKNKADIAEIYISGDIVDDADGGLINAFLGDTTGYDFPAKIKARLDEVKDKPLEIHINSCGGDVFAGTAMANFIARHKPKTTAIIDGIAASIASQIFFSADECRIPANGYLMIHKPSIFVQGDANDLQKAVEILDTLQAGIETTYNKKAREGVTAEKIHEMVNAETWLTGADAVQYFNVELDEPVKAENFVGIKDSLKAAGVKKIPEPLLNLSETKKRVKTSGRRKNFESMMIQALR